MHACLQHSMLPHPIQASVTCLQIADEGFDGVHQESVIFENLPKEKILGKLSEEEAKAGADESTFEPPPIDSVLNLYDLEQVRRSPLLRIRGRQYLEPPVTVSCAKCLKASGVMY
jgi:hypothetical protein